MGKQKMNKVMNLMMDAGTALSQYLQVPKKERKLLL
jgi:hypothetical protein